ncbi:MAG: PepSY-associated TM helix domain-containing protein [Rhizobacter sp.]
MKEGFRQSMAWLHTYSGLLVGWVLFVVFAAGTASYFKDEITFWMKPELHAATFSALPQGEVVERAVHTLQERGPDAPRWFITLPTEREPGVRATWTKPPPPKGQKPEPGRRRAETAMLDPATGEKLADARETRGGEFLYRLHFDLHYMPALWARWIVGVCAMFMLVAILSGIVTHRRIFADFFTFRPKKGQRSWLDAHNATAVLALPYHLMITYTGLVTLMFMYMPWGPQAAYKGDNDKFFSEVFPSSGPRNAKPAGKPAELVAIGPMVAQAEEAWGKGMIGRVTVNHPNDAAATVIVSRQDGLDMSSSQPSMMFNGTTGAFVSKTGDAPGAGLETRGVLYGLHIGRFGNPFIRALFFLSGLAGCAMVATGLLLWATKERPKHLKALAKGERGSFALRLVDGLNIAAVAGLPIAMATFFWVNRLLPVPMAERPQTEINLFFAAWAVSAVAGLAWPARRMWQVQLGVAAALFAAIPLLNAATTSSNLVHTISTGLWRVAGFDLVCLALGITFGFCCWWLGRPKHVRKHAPARQRESAPAPLNTSEATS